MTVSPPAAETPLLSMRGITVSYGPIAALRGADFDLYPGEIHALVGAHRAGKSSLVKLLSGAVRKDGGEILFHGRRVEGFTPQSALRSGIGIVYQHLNIIPSLSAAENVFAGRMPRAGLFGLDLRRMRDETRALFSRLAFPIDVEVPVNRLTAAEQHMVELARVLSFDPGILILDEVSSKLTPEEMERIYPLLLRLRAEGKSVIYISHNMDEIFQFADRVTILKDGRSMDTERIQDLDRIKLIKLTYSFVLSREELGRQNLELLTLKRYNENILKNIPVGVIILNEENRTYLINYAAVEILGLAEGASGRPFAELVTAEDLPDIPLVMEKINARQELSLEEASFRGAKTLKVSVFPFRDEDYVFLGTIVLMEDVSLQRSIDDYLVRAEKISSTAELAAGVAHEINNPLGIVQNYVELLKIKALDPDARLKLGKIENEVSRIEKIIGSLLSFSKFTDVTFQDIDVRDVLQEVILLLEHRLAEKGIRMDCRLPPERAVVLGDESKLKQLFVNLLANSIEAVPDAGEIGASVSLDGEGSAVEVTITDNGCGVPPDIIDRIFDPFFSTKKARKNAGLGLSISQRIVELHNGMLTCTSRPGEATRFSVRLPRAAAAG